MKAFLMYRDRDFYQQADLPPNAADLTQDLELTTLFSAMAAGDEFLLEVAKDAVLTCLHEPEEILYRQNVMADCLERAEIVRELYGIAVEAVEREKRIWGWLSKYPDSMLRRSIEVLQLFVDLVKQFRRMSEEHGAKFRSEGFVRFFKMLATELDDAYLSSVEEHLIRLGFRDGLVMSAELGKGNKGTHYILRKLPQVNRKWTERFQMWWEKLIQKDGSSYVYEIADRDEAGFRALSELKARGISHVAIALAQATDHILSFFTMLRTELGFYIGCLNLRERLARKSEVICFPLPFPPGTAKLSSKGLYDICLSLTMEGNVIANDVSGDDKLLVMITGANRGGKSTFLRSIGLAQLMMQSGMFVAAESFSANVHDGVFTHFKREEDVSMRSGKLDEELSRMNAIVEKMKPVSVVLLNESFASTNEREGSEIARQIVHALLEMGIKVFYVTHLFDLAHSFYLAKTKEALFLRTERLADGQRTFRLVEGEPLPTSFGEDLYRRIFQTPSRVAVESASV
ncbi:MAG TPA: hypothetical protein VH601_24490 [Bryobacteraceae bacterium]|jgi:DNA mismatch repair ATPase MutS